MPAVGTASGPQLMLNGAAVVAGQFGAWQPIAAEAAESGYVVIWKDEDADLFFVWNTDAKGNYLWTSMGASRARTTRSIAETLFAQDLSGDGKIGIAADEPALALLH